MGVNVRKCDDIGNVEKLRAEMTSELGRVQLRACSGKPGYALFSVLPNSLRLRKTYFCHIDDCNAQWKAVCIRSRTLPPVLARIHSSSASKAGQD